MDKATRVELLRQRFRAKGGMPWRASGSSKERVDRALVEKRPPNHRDFTCGFQDADRRPEWFTKPDCIVKAKIPLKHRKGVPALTVIAAKAPKKLVRAFANAEQLLASRVRR